MFHFSTKNKDRKQQQFEQENLYHFLCISFFPAFFKKEAKELETLFDRFDNDTDLMKFTKESDRDIWEKRKVVQRKKRFLTCGCCNMVETATSRLWRCNRCDIQYYCSKECQTKHWKVHKHVCKPITQMKV